MPRYTQHEKTTGMIFWTPVPASAGTCLIRGNDRWVPDEAYRVRSALYRQLRRAGVTVDCVSQTSVTHFWMSTGY